MPILRFDGRRALGLSRLGGICFEHRKKPHPEQVLVNTEADPDHVRLGMRLRLVTFPIGTDSNGTEAIGFGFEPDDNGSEHDQTQEVSEP